MKVLMTILLILTWLVAVYFGWIHFVGKTMATNPETESNSQQSDKLKLKQTTQAEELKDQQRQLMIERQTRMRDMQRR